ncbi:molybdopterin biosynthesis protein MoeB [Staphylococcus devriesei]|uniref:Molybdopterin biosynthesis protein MoeB n=1 Tax=Staphylococcus devriesei TaxID=586733 RepID=A0A2K4DKH5_9STAP|nr:ThiF family adenylyltransferase [Staphylococcus devriesei]MCE5090053.1 ThiF family adenylyltransferase [Staphylococcus devriesei]MCE5097859.1 ThiF family adenylyltransferase [Staphylococcus devriesei]PNZ86984.1 molybdopterin biosynthesis protein MoeB [Staphylococcus devriesei]PTE72423.1 molybdopterin biosynthesis protein MoeB [Staphylococcus devriesei]PTF04418.1 molybdopterin biosynthesis protein MoeB [Staphylococcus devriesei]
MTTGRYSRQTLFKGIGVLGQEKIEQKHVLIVGMGALGTHVAEGLVRAGIKKLTIVDRDYIEYSNLQRQTLFTEEDANQMLPKVMTAKHHLEQIRHDVEIYAHIAHVDYYFLEKYGTDVDVIIDATDNFDTRQLINDFSYKEYIPWIYGGVVQSTYVEAAFIPGKTPCFNCLMPQLPIINMTCDTVGVIQPAVTMTTSFQLRDALKLLTDNVIPTKLTYGDIWEGEHYTFGFSRMHREECPTCGSHPTFPHLKHNPTLYATLCGRDTVQYDNPNITQEMIRDFLHQHQLNYRENKFMLMFEYKGYRLVAFQGGRILVHGTTKTSEAINLINQLFG